MSSTTSRMGLYKPVGAEFVNVTTDLNNNWDKIDANLGFASCTSTTRPSTVWAGLCIYETNTARTYVSNGTAPASGSWIEIPNGSGALATTVANITAAATGTDAITVKVTGNANSRIIVNGDGSVEWGDGTAAVDTNLYRPSANNLKTDDTFTAANFATTGVTNITAAATGTDSLTVKVTGDTINRLIINGDGSLEWGPGGASAIDTNLYRSAANTLKTDDSLIVSGNLTVTGVGQVQYAVKSASTSRTSNSLSADPHLTLPLVANAVYLVEFYLYHNNSTTGGFQTDWTVPASATGLKGTIGATSATGATFVTRQDTNARFSAHNYSTAAVYHTETGTVDGVAWERSILTTAASSGNVTLRWAQVTATGTTSLDVGSFMTVRRLA